MLIMRLVSHAFWKALLVSHCSQVMLSCAMLITEYAISIQHCLQIANGGGLEALFVDTAGRVISSSYGDRVAIHEAGHFLCAYLVGLLPRRYTLSSLDALKRCSIPL